MTYIKVRQAALKVPHLLSQNFENFSTNQSIARVFTAIFLVYKNFNLIPLISRSNDIKNKLCRVKHVN